jgi:hypothetical protein
MHYAALRLFLCDEITDPLQECLAYRLPFSFDDPSEYWHMVQETENDPYLPERIHGLIPRAKAADFVATLQENGQSITWMGTTYCVEPYALGFAHFGEKDRPILQQCVRSIHVPEHLVTYIRQWAGTEEGSDHVLRTIATADEKGRTATRKSVTNDADRYSLVDDYINNFYLNQQPNRMFREHKERADEFIAAIRPLTENEMGEKAMDFYRVQKHQKLVLRIKAREYTATAPLLQPGRAA